MCSSGSARAHTLNSMRVMGDTKHNTALLLKPLCEYEDIFPIFRMVFICLRASLCRSANNVVCFPVLFSNLSWVCMGVVLLQQQADRRGH